MARLDAFDLISRIYTIGALSRAELAEQLHVAPSHIGVLIRDAINRGVLIERGAARSTGGRPRVLLQVNPDAAQLIGIDVGRTNTTIVVTDLLGNILSHDWFPTALEEGRDGSLHALDKQVRSRMSQYSGIAAIGIAHSGIVDSKAGRMLLWPMVDGWKGTPLRQIFEDKYALPVVLDDRIRAMGIAERRAGHLVGFKNLVLVYVGTGIMSAIFFEGMVYHGRDGLAGELGHTTVVENGEPCSCGNRGCLERYSSAGAIVQRARVELDRGVSSVLSEALESSGRLSIENIVEAAVRHDRVAERLLAEAGMYLGTALASVINLLNPETIILTGKVPQAAGDLLLRPLLYEVRQRAFSLATDNLPVVVSRLGPEAAAVGVAHLAGREAVKAIWEGRFLGGRSSRGALTRARKAARV